MPVRVPPPCKIQSANTDDENPQPQSASEYEYDECMAWWVPMRKSSAWSRRAAMARRAPTRAVACPPGGGATDLGEASFG